MEKEDHRDEDECARNRPMRLQHRYSDERERLYPGMTDEQRAYRAQYVKDQILAPDEPREVPELVQAFQNPIKRIYRAPWNGVQALVSPVVGPEWAKSIRYYTPKFMMGVFALYVITYYYKYNMQDWTTRSGWRMIHTKRRSWPGDEDYPRPRVRHHPWDYADRGFKNRKVFLD